MLHPKSTEISFLLNNGVRMPALGLGTANPPEKIAETKQAVKAAIKAGYRNIDTAWAYGSEPFIGEAIKELIEEGAIKREDLFITTKVWPVLWDDAEKSLSESLKSLGLDYVDLWLQHWPLCYNKRKDPHGINGLARNPEKDDGSPDFNEEGDWLETYKQMERIYSDPKDSRVRAIGVSNFPVEYLKRVLKEASVKPVLNQVEMHPRLPQFELNEFCHENDIKLTAYSPFGSHGAPLTSYPPIKEVAQKYGVSANDVLTSFHIRQGNTVVPRSINSVRIASNIEFVPLSKEDLDKLRELGHTDPKRYINESWNSAVPGFSGTGPKI